MHIVIRSFDGDVHYAVDADDIDDALKKLGQHLGYTGYGPMCTDLGYTGRDFEVSVITDGRDGTYDAASDRALVDGQRASIVKGAFKFMRRNG